MENAAEDLEVFATGSEFFEYFAPSPAIFSGGATEGPGYRIRRSRGTDNFLLIVSIGGAGRVVAGGRESRVAEGEAALWRPGTPHDYGVAPGEGEWRILWAHFLPRPHWTSLLTLPESSPGYARIPFRERSRLVDRFAALHEALARADRFSELLALNALEEILTFLHDPASPEFAPAVDLRVSRALAHIDRHYAEELTLSRLAAAVGLSPSRLSHLFREQLGRGVRESIEATRMGHARRLLRHTSMPVHDVAAAVGFEDPFYFSNRFRTAHGCSPRKYREAADRP